MTWKYTIKPTIECNDEKVIDENIQLKQKCQINFSPHEQLILQLSGFKNLDEVITYKVLNIHSEKFSSMAVKELHTADFFVQLGNQERLGAINFFIF